MFLQSTVLLGLFATSFALPAPDAQVKTLLARAPYPASVNCEGTVFTKEQIYDAVQQSWTRSGKYPASFGNKSGSSKVFPNIPDGNKLLEYPLADPKWTNGEPGKYRVVVSDPKGTYIGVMIHNDGVGGNFKACDSTPVTKDPNPPNPPNVNPPNVNPPNINPPNVPGRV